MEDCLKVLKNGGHFAKDGRTFLLAQLAFWLLCASDGHAKNFSLFLLPGGIDRLTPLYDVLSGWPLIGNGPNDLAYPRVKMAMALRGREWHYKVSGMLPRHWEATARRSGIASMRRHADLFRRNLDTAPKRH